MRIIAQEQTRRLQELFYLIQEFGRSEDLGEWNKVQFGLWIDLSKKGLVDVDDIDLFSKFGKFFYDFWTNTKRIPSIRDLKQDFLMV